MKSVSSNKYINKCTYVITKNLVKYFVSNNYPNVNISLEITDSVTKFQLCKNYVFQTYIAHDFELFIELWINVLKIKKTNFKLKNMLKSLLYKYVSAYIQTYIYFAYWTRY